MNVTCPACKTRYSVDDARVPASGVTIKCPKCSHTFVAKRSDSAAVALPGSTGPSGAVALPGSTGPSGAVALPPSGAPAYSSVPPAATDGLGDLDLGLDEPSADVGMGAGSSGLSNDLGLDDDSGALDAGILDFINEDAGAAAGPPAIPGELRIRRRNGTIEGPYGKGRIIAMLKAGDFSGGEDISNDGMSWRAMTGDAELNATLNEVAAAQDQQHMAAMASQPSAAAAPAGPASLADVFDDDDDLALGPPPGGPGHTGEEGEFAVADVPEMPPIWQTYKKPIMAFLGVVAFALVGVATHFFTPVGAFGIPALIAVINHKEPPPPPPKPPPPAPKLADMKEVQSLIDEHCFECFRSVFATVAQAGALVPDNVLAASKARGFATLAFGPQHFPLKDLVAAVEALNTIDISKAKGGNTTLANVEMLKTRAALEILSGQAEAAVPQLQAVLEQRRDEREIALLLGYALKANKKPDEAAKVLDASLVSAARYAPMLHLIGNLLETSEATNSAADAATWYEKALQASPADGRSALAAEKIYNTSHRFGERRRVRFLAASKANRGLPPDERAPLLFRTAEDFDAQGRLPEASEFAIEAARLDPQNSKYVALAAVAKAEANKTDEALASLDLMIERNPNDIDARLGRARVHDMAQNISKTFVDLDAASKAAPKDYRTYLLEARINRELGKMNDARKSLEKGIRLTTDDATPLVRMGVVELTLGDVEGAYGRAQAAVKLDAHSAPARALLGTTLANRGQLRDAEKSFKKALKLDDENIEARLGYANALRDLGTSNPPGEAEGLAQAMPLYLDLMRDHEGDARVLFEYGRALELSGRLEEALALYRQATTVDAKDPRPHLKMAAAYLERDPPDIESAKKTVDQARTIEMATGGQNAEVRFWEARLYLAQDKLHEAQSAMEQAAALEKKNANYHYWLGRTMERNNSLFQAIEAYEEAVRLNSRLAVAHKALGRTAIDRHQYTKARTHYEAYRGARPDDPTVWYDIGRSYELQNLDRKAMDAYKKVVAARPEHAAAWVAVGRIYSRQGKGSDAEKAFGRAVKADPDYIPGVCQLGVIRSRKGVSKASRKLLNQCTASAEAPDDMKVSAQELLEEI